MKRPDWLPALATTVIVALVIWLYGPALHNSLVDWDDYVYLQEAANHPRLSWATVEWACRTTRPFYFHPLARLSHVLDFQLWGRDPAGHHLASIVLHGLNVALVILLVQQLLGGIPAWRPTERRIAALGVGLAFGIHPLQVESVAWVAERKTVLCGLFFLAALATYLRAVGGTAFRDGLRTAADRAGGRAADQLTAGHPPSARPGWFPMFLGGLALLSKPMAVSLPLVMLVIDFYPLRRHRLVGWGRLIREKWFLIAGAAAVSVATLLPSMREGGVTGLARLDVASRLLVAGRNLVFYAGKTLWPRWLSPYYPLEGLIPVGAPEYWLSALAVAAVAVLVIGRRRRAPGLAAIAMGFVGLLLPVSGLFQTGAQAAADRFMYLALVPLLLAMAWLVRWAWNHFRAPGRWAVVALAGFELMFWGFTTRGQIGVWRNDITLWSEVIAHFPDSALANCMMGNGLLRAGQVEMARPFAEKAVAMSPDLYKARATLGLIDYSQGRYAEAAAELAAALHIRPDLAGERYRLACAWGRLGRYPEALAALRIAIGQDPSFRRAAVADPAFEVLARDPAWSGEFRALTRTVDAGGRPGSVAIP